MLELIYLLVVNALLALPATQVLANQIKPEKFQISWDRAWSWYPVRVHVTGLSVDGESRTQQWQVQTPDASASISLLPLIFKRVWISDVSVIDIDYRQRPRLKPDKDYSDLLSYFPDIGTRELTPVGKVNSKKKSPWHIAVNDMSASGEHNFWVLRMRGAAAGGLAGDMTFETRGGPFSLDLSQLDLDVQPLLLDGDHEMISGGTLTGSMGFAPIVLKENKGVAMLAYLTTDVEVDLDMRDLSFLDLFLLKLDGVSVDGKGRVTGRLRFDQGQVLAPTGIDVDARELHVEALSHTIGGEGSVTLAMDDPTLGEGLHLGFHYEGLTVHAPGSDSDLLVGKGLELVVRGNGSLLPDEGSAKPIGFVELTVEGLAVPDLSKLQNYLPPQLPLQINGGDGVLDSTLHLSTNSMEVDLVLRSADADISLREYRFSTDLEFVLALDNPDISTQGTSIGGSYLSLSGSRVQRTGKELSGGWDTRFGIDRGVVSLDGDPSKRAKGEVGDLLKDLSDADASNRLALLWANIELSASMSNLEWITALIASSHPVALDGSGQLLGEIHVEQGKLEPPSHLRVSADDLSLGVLDYVSRGQGEIGLDVEKGHPQPVWSLGVALRDADLRRRSDKESHIENVQLTLDAKMSPSKEEGKKLQAEELDFRITSAEVTDMSVFNSYLPRDGSMALTGGTAKLESEIQLRPRDAGGWLKLVSHGASALVAEQAVGGDIVLDVQLTDGVPQDMAFDISGSSLRLDNVRVEGERAAYAGDEWSALFTLERGQAVWREPVKVRAQGQLLISDSRPFVTMFENGGWRPNFLSRILTIEDVEGQVALSIVDNTLYIEDAQVLSDKLELGARGSLSDEGRDAMLYLRYKKLDGLLKFSGQDRNLDIINARKTYDAFRPVFPVVGRPVEQNVKDGAGGSRGTTTTD